MHAGGRCRIVADPPVEQSTELDRAGKARGLDHIQIMTPLNSEKRLQEIAGAASGFLYCVARKGVTGHVTDFNQELAGYMQRCRAVTKLPLALGFGIKTSNQIKTLKGVTDIAIIGTACLEVWEQQGVDGFRKYLLEMSQARG